MIRIVVENPTERRIYKCKLRDFKFHHISYNFFYFPCFLRMSITPYPILSALQLMYPARGLSAALSGAHVQPGSSSHCPTPRHLSSLSITEALQDIAMTR